MGELGVTTTYWLIPMDRPVAPSLEISARLRSQLVYFITPADAPQVPPLPANEYWIDAVQAAQWLADGVLELVSPLDEEHRTTVEFSEEQEAFLEWLVTHQVQHVRLQERPDKA
jgi:hypothetical protein